MSKQEKPRCAGTVWNETHWPKPCTRKGVLEHDGKHYCKTHHPPTMEARRKASGQAIHERIAAELEEARVKRAAAVEQKRRADCFDELVEALRYYANESFDGYGQPNGAVAQDAIAKSTGDAQ